MSPSNSPTYPPTPITYCPPAYSRYKTDYVAGERVEVDGSIFGCAGGTAQAESNKYEPYCNIADQSLLGYEELELWNSAWVYVGPCYRTETPTGSPSLSPAAKHTPGPSIQPSGEPSHSGQPSAAPSSKISSSPSQSPSKQTTDTPTTSPSLHPTLQPTSSPIESPSLTPSISASLKPSSQPSLKNSAKLSMNPSLTTHEPPSVNYVSPPQRFGTSKPAHTQSRTNQLSTRPSTILPSTLKPTRLNPTTLNPTTPRLIIVISTTITPPTLKPTSFMPTGLESTNLRTIDDDYAELLAKFPYPYPYTRYTPWSILESEEKTVAGNLGYDRSSWDNLEISDLESFGYVDLSAEERLGVMTLGMDANMWDCYMNHYSGYNWAYLQVLGVTLYLETLGYSQLFWDDDIGYVATEDMNWHELSLEQQDAAYRLCYFENSWDWISLTEW